jgi:succinate dehydrogenase hydrophobic membrane anchor protein
MKKNYSLNWVLQKVFAVIFLILLFYVYYSLNNISLNNYKEISYWFSVKINSTIFFILFSSILLHSNLGLNSIIDDYIHTPKNKKIIIILKNCFLITIYILITLSLISLI